MFDNAAFFLKWVVEKYYSRFWILAHTSYTQIRRAWCWLEAVTLQTHNCVHQEARTQLFDVHQCYLFPITAAPVEKSRKGAHLERSQILAKNIEMILNSLPDIRKFKIEFPCPLHFIRKPFLKLCFIGFQRQAFLRINDVTRVQMLQSSSEAKKEEKWNTYRATRTLNFGIVQSFLGCKKKRTSIRKWKSAGELSAEGEWKVIPPTDRQAGEEMKKSQRCHGLARSKT